VSAGAKRSHLERYQKRGARLRVSSPALYFGYKRWALFLRALRQMRRGQDLRRHTKVSHEIYEEYDDFEMRLFETGARYTYRYGRMGVATFREIRQAYVEPVAAEIEALAALNPGRRLRVLEVGCGNGTNLMLLRERFGERVELEGFDISARRIELGREYWGARLDQVTLRTDSATTLAGYADGAVDLIYSVHCLEQLPYYVRDAVAAMARVARARIVFVEPVWEFANAAQQLYSLFGDQLRTLMPEVAAHPGLRIARSWPLEILANPLNKTGVIVAERVPSQDASPRAPSEPLERGATG